MVVYGYASDSHEFSGHYWVSGSQEDAKAEVRGYFASRRIRNDDHRTFDLVFEDDWYPQDMKKVWDV